ncbi:MAG: dihydroorotase family protein [Candidatus Hodarchaeota archaeon]
MRTHDLKIMNGRLVLSDRIETGDIIINDGLITAILKPGVSATEQATEVINASGLLVLPGLVDVHVHFRDPGHPEKEDFASGSLAAAAGGITTIADMPNTDPPTTTPQRLMQKIKRAEEKCLVDFSFHAGPYYKQEGEKNQETSFESMELALVDMAKQMLDLGIISFKIYIPHHESPAIQYLAPLGHLLTIHAEDPATLFEPTDGSSFAFLASRPPEAEIKALQTLLAKPPSCSLHICHLSTAAGFRHVLSAQHRGVNVSSEVTPHHLLLTVKDLAKLGPVAKCYPPLRSVKDAEALLNACFAGQINIIASDHAPHTTAEKTGASADFASAPGGIIGVETSFPLLYTKLVHQAEMTLPQLVKLMGYNPAYRFGIRNSQWIEKGQLVVGADADLVLFDPKSSNTIRGDSLHSKSTLTPFEGWKVQGQIKQTLLRGSPIFNRDQE